MLPRVMMALLALPACLAAQSVAEYSLGMSTALGTAGAASRLGNAAADRLRKQGEGVVKTSPKNLPRAASTSAPGSTPSQTVSASSAPTPRPAGAEDTVTATPPLTPVPQSVPAVTYEDPAGIKEGMDSSEVLRRFGPPSMKLASTAGEETLCYSRQASSLDVIVRNGKVDSVRRSAPPQATVVLR